MQLKAKTDARGYSFCSRGHTRRFEWRFVHGHSQSGAASPAITNGRQTSKQGELMGTINPHQAGFKSQSRSQSTSEAGRLGAGPKEINHHIRTCNVSLHFGREAFSGLLEQTPRGQVQGVGLASHALTTRP